MIKVFATNAVISKGYDNNPALKFSDNGDSVRFRIGVKVFDTRCDNNTRWFNLTAKAFDKTLVERIKKMKLKEGSYINISGKLDEDVWTDQGSNERKSATVIVIDDIEYATAGSGEKSDKPTQTEKEEKGETEKPESSPENSNGSGFTGFEPFSGGNFFDT